MTKPHEKLDAWIYSMQLVKEIYNMTADFPAEERFGLTSQMRRAAVSIPSNISKVQVAVAPENLHITSVWPEVHYLNWKHRQSWQKC